MPLANERLGLVVGDASGKGVAAALMIASVQSSLRTAALFMGENPATLLKIVNLQAYASSLADRYATVFYGVFDRATRALRYVNAGHTPSIVLRSDGSIDTLETGGVAGTTVAADPAVLDRMKLADKAPGAAALTK